MNNSFQILSVAHCLRSCEITNPIAKQGSKASPFGTKFKTQLCLMADEKQHNLHYFKLLELHLCNIYFITHGLA